MSRCFRSVQNRFMNDIFCSARLLSAKCSKFPTSSSNYLTKHCCKVLRLKIGSECGSRMCKKTYRQATTTLNSRRKPVKFYSSRSSKIITISSSVVNHFWGIILQRLYKRMHININERDFFQHVFVD